jgi:hypothetical protein
MSNQNNFVVKNGLTVGTNTVINSSGMWVGSSSGLIGATGQPVGDRWRKMKTISDTVEMWYIR